MAIVLNGTTGITTPDLDSAADISVYGVTVGRGAGAVATNTAVGASALAANTTGATNTAVGSQALQANTTASSNTAVGYQAGYLNVTGTYNTYIGTVAGYSATGSNNTFIGCSSAGYGAGYFVTTGAKNTILGGYNGNQGGLDIRTASNYVVLSDGDGNPRIYHSGATLYSTLSASAGSFAVKTAAGGAITYDSSSARYKDNIRDSEYGLAAVMQLRSAMFEYKDSGRTDVGFIAEEVDLVIPELVPKIDNIPEAVSYDRMVSVLVKAIQEQQAIITALTARIETLEGN